MHIPSERFERSENSRIQLEALQTHLFTWWSGARLLPGQVSTWKNHYPTQIVLHHKRLARIRYHRPPFSLFEVSSSQKTGFRAPQEHSRDSANESSCYHYHSERSQAKFKHQSATKFKICTHGSEVHNCRKQRVFFLPLITITDSPLNFCHKQQVKKGRDGAVVLSTWSVSNETENLMTNIWFKLNQRAKIP